MKSLTEVERVTRDAYVTLILCSIVLVTMHHRYYLTVARLSRSW
jgi:hypothetical protein